MNIYTFNLPINNTPRKVLSILDPSEIKDPALLPKAIVGYFIDPNDAVVTANISINPNFLKFFHQTVVFASLQSVQLLEAAEQKNSGFVYIIDRRSSEDKKAKPQDVIGSFEVINGEISADSYQANAQYQLISEDGIFKLPDAYEQILLAALID